MKERLIELLITSPMLDVIGNEGWEWEIAADYLLANGVIVPPCNVGDYIIWAEGGKRELHQVKAFRTDPNFGLRYILDEFSPKVNHESIIRIVPREEAEQKLKEIENND